MAASSHRFQAPKGTRDFYPPEMAVRRHLESIWREVSINHGFDEIEGPTFEHLDLYTVKSGPGIVSELFSFRREGGDVDYALRPEFTPTLARMYAARAHTLPSPTKWFCIENNFRAERPQRGRLREFFQWNVDVIGDDSPRADAEVIAVAIGVLERMGLTAADVRIKLSHRESVSHLLSDFGLPEDRHAAAFDLLDRRDKLDPDIYEAKADHLGFTEDMRERFQRFTQRSISRADLHDIAVETHVDPGRFEKMAHVADQLEMIGKGDWIEFDLGIVRGLAYYTGTVFEIHEASGNERAIAGGGRYDRLIELFGGPPTPAVGFAMGDVVIRLVLEDKGLLADAETYLPRPDVFLITAKQEHDAAAATLLANLRRDGFHVRHTYRSTRNVGKLLGEANKTRARFAVILGDEMSDGRVALKNLEAGEQRDVALDRLTRALREALDR
jgi:histidyl-tRNA synthetase